ncbi:hypothetical protein AAG906_003460 [Vitis piasezkii]
MTKIFKPLIGQTMEVYIDDIVVKSKTRSEHALHLEETFCMMKTYNMKLNPTKCAFGVSACKFLGFMVTQRGIELSNVQANLEKLSEWVVKRIPSTENVQANALAGIATTLLVKEAILLPIYLQVASSIVVAPICSASETGISWMHEIETYLLIGNLPKENKHAHKIWV